MKSSLYENASSGEFESGASSTRPVQSAGKFFCRAPPIFVSTSSSSRFGERFRDGQHSLVSFLFAVLLLTVPPPCPAICKSEGHVPPVPYGAGATERIEISYSCPLL